MNTTEILKMATNLKNELDMMNHCAKDDNKNYYAYRRACLAMAELMQDLKIDVVINYTYDKEVDKVIASLVYVRIPKTDKIVFMPCFYSKLDKEIVDNLFEAVDTFKKQGAICCKCDYNKCKICGKWSE